MKLRGIEFGYVFVASGGSNFFFNGWSYDKVYRHIPGYTLEGVTHITKTATLPALPGNMPLNYETLQPVDKFPDCIYVNFWKCFVVNAVGLSNTGLEDLARRNIWQQMQENFIISIMAVGKTPAERIKEFVEMRKIFERIISESKVQFAIAINESCPNAKHDLKELTEEAPRHFRVMHPLGIPLIAKFNLLVPIFYAGKIADTGCCDAFDIPNTYPFYELPQKFRESLFGDGDSPLNKYGGGGYSGPWQTSLTAEWIHKARSADIDLPIIAGSIYRRRDVKLMKEAGANAIALGAVKILRPYRLKGIIYEAKKYFGG